MKEIGEAFKEARETIGISKSEVIKDLKEYYDDQIKYNHESSGYDEYAVQDYDIDVIGTFVFCTVYSMTINLTDVYDINGEVVYQYVTEDESKEEVFKNLLNK